MTAVTASKPVLVDSSGWLECLTSDTNAEKFAPYLTGTRHILVPTIVLYEVYKKLQQAAGKTAADAFVSQALRQEVVLLNEAIALGAADLSLQYRLAMADAMIYATARYFDAELVTSDGAFAELPGVTLV